MNAHRTTVRLDPDLAARLRKVAGERGISFSEALNAALRTGLSASTVARRSYRVPVRRLGLRGGLDLDRALGLSRALEDSERVRKLKLHTVDPLPRA
jgi:predicted transcriptional regulator